MTTRLHLREPTHDERFVAVLDEHSPSWRTARLRLDALPVAAGSWGE